MYFICYDFETTGRNSNWDQIIQVAAVLANENLEEMDSFESSCFLKPGTIPEPGALMVNERIPGEETNLSHYELVKLMRRKFTDWVKPKLYELELALIKKEILYLQINKTNNLLLLFI